MSVEKGGKKRPKGTECQGRSHTREKQTLPCKYVCYLRCALLISQLGPAIARQCQMFIELIMHHSFLERRGKKQVAR